MTDYKDIKRIPIVAADVPNIDASKITTGTLSTSRYADNNTTYSVQDGELSENNFTDTDHTKLNGIEASATADQTKTDIEGLGIDLPAANLTGSIATARLGSGTASSTTVLYGDGTYKAEPVTDTTSIENDISILALQTAINGNLSAYGLKNSWIEQFEDSTKIENLSTAIRDASGEFMMAGTVGSQTQIAQGTGTPIGDMTNMGGLAAAFNTTNPETAANGAGRTGNHMEAWLGKDWGVDKTVNGFKHWSSSNDGTNHHGHNTSGCSITLYGNSSNDTSSAVNLGGLTGLNFRSMSTEYSKLTGLTTSTAYRYHWLRFSVTSTAGEHYSAETQFYENPNTVSAAGSFNSTDVTPSDGAAKTSVGLVLLYKDAGSSSCVLNTDVVAKVRANTGQAYQTLVLAGIDGTTTPAVTYSNSQKIAIAPAITVTSGTALSYEITWANQSDGSKEAQIYGVAMTY